MSASRAAAPPGLWRTTALLLSAAWRRGEHRRNRQQELARQQGAKNAMPAGFSVLLLAVVMVGIHIAAGYIVNAAVVAAHRVELERKGYLFVPDALREALLGVENAMVIGIPKDVARARARLNEQIAAHARDHALRHGGAADARQRLVENAVSWRPELLLDASRWPGLRHGVLDTRVPAMIGSLVMLWWVVGMVLHGEGQETNLDRRMHPMWEWLLSHPIPPAAVVVAEMLAPITNPVFLTAPVFVATLYRFGHGAGAEIAGGLLVGVPLAIAIGALGNTVENTVLLRAGARSRGAIVALLNWAGAALLLALLFCTVNVNGVARAVTPLLRPLAVLPWPWLGFFLGLQPDGTLSLTRAIVQGWVVVAALFAGAVALARWSVADGITGSDSAAVVAPTSTSSGPSLVRDPLMRKEILWFRRDRSALVQTFLMPLTLAAPQLFNLRGLAAGGVDASTAATAAVVVGTALLWVMGPRSLASEGRALWIALTWPNGLDDLLRAKARFQSAVASCVVGVVLTIAALFFPGDLWMLALVAVGWLAFSRSMAAKSVTLVSLTSESGELEPVPAGRRWAAGLGAFTFAIGVGTRQWHLALTGIVYSWMSAAAMWQNLRARLPFLYDRWSEQLPPAPSLMHAMVAIAALVEAGAILGVIATVFGADPMIARAVGYSVTAMVVCYRAVVFLEGRGVDFGEVWRWPAAEGAPASGMRRFAGTILFAAVSGVVMGLLVKGPYIGLLRWLMAGSRLPDMSLLDHDPLDAAALFVLAVVCAPFAEEYLFRGLFYRALDREWGGWRAVAGSAAFFAIYHPPLSWLPVAAVGVAAALLFKRSGRLLAAVVLHLVYNAVVLI